MVSENEGISVDGLEAPARVVSGSLENSGKECRDEEWITVPVTGKQSPRASSESIRVKDTPKIVGGSPSRFSVLATVREEWEIYESESIELYMT